MREYTAFWPFLVLLLFMAFFLVENLVDLESRRTAASVTISLYDTRVKEVQKQQDLYVALGQELLRMAKTDSYADQISSEFHLRETVPSPGPASVSSSGTLTPPAEVPDAGKAASVPAPTDVPATANSVNTPLEPETGKSNTLPSPTEVPGPGKSAQVPAPHDVPESATPAH